MSQHAASIRNTDPSKAYDVKKQNALIEILTNEVIVCHHLPVYMCAL
jgi:hypothetical protein